MNDDYYHDNRTQVEFITIVEGPSPAFTPTSEDWPWSLIDGPDGKMCTLCKLRTFDGTALAERCRIAWQEDRPVRLDYPDGEGGRQEADILAVRVDTVQEGDILYLWVSL